MFAKPCEMHGHRYFVADVAQVNDEGKVVVIALCTSCGDWLTHSTIVSLPNAKLTLLKQESRKED